MNYFDASALVKRYVRQAGTSTVRRLVAQGSAATSRLSEAEVSSALARRHREGTLSAVQHGHALNALRADLERLHVVELSPSVVSRAHVLLATHALRAGDALQLACALALRDALGTPLTLVGYDVRLRAAAVAEGLSLRPRIVSPSALRARTPASSRAADR